MKKSKQASGRDVRAICGYVCDPAGHDGVAFEALPALQAGQEKFNKV